MGGGPEFCNKAGTWGFLLLRSDTAALGITQLPLVTASLCSNPRRLYNLLLP